MVQGQRSKVHGSRQKLKDNPQITQITQISYKDKGDGESLMFSIHIEGIRRRASGLKCKLEGAPAECGISRLDSIYFCIQSA